VQPDKYAENISHYGVLRTLLAMYDLPPFAQTAMMQPIRAIWDQAKMRAP